MNMNHVAKLFKGGFATCQYGHLLNDISSMGSIGMTAKDAVICSNEEFQHTLRLAHRLRLAVGTPEGLLTNIGYSLFL